MVKIDGEFLEEYLKLDKDIKNKTKKANEMKKQIIKELTKRKGKSIVTRLFIASFTIQQRPIFNIPMEIKNKYRELKDYKILKVMRRKAE